MFIFRIKFRPNIFRPSFQNFHMHHISVPNTYTCLIKLIFLNRN
jgi:hypothetical protein